ncbi:MAG: hypothetical protein M3396_01755 [Actinomycetota bacterium]|nr:hypothetical protein [Actinomycetota bacterium]MDQ3574601.1 hypothetical protein [Actinomycetota bacterium]
MASWVEVESSAPELAAAARAFFDPHSHRRLAPCPLLPESRTIGAR